MSLRKALVVLAAAASAVSAAPAAFGSGASTFTDAQSDGNGAPDIRTVDWESIAAPTSAVASDTTGVSFRINRSDLGGTGAFDFAVFSAAGGNFDSAPDAGKWSYPVQIAAPRQAPPAASHLVIPAASILPVAGRAFRFKVGAVLLDDGTSVPPATVSCKATLGGRPIAGTGSGGCTWKLPVSARGKSLVVTVTVTYRGLTATRRFPLKVS